jgi:hypothetical protein
MGQQKLFNDDDFEENQNLKGHYCKSCGQYVKVYKRKITSAMAYALILIYKKNQKDYNYFHVEDYLKSLNIPSTIRGDFPKLRFWGLIEKITGRRADGNKRVGFYRITDKGKNFINGKVSVKKFCLIYNNKSQGFIGEDVTFKDTLKQKFDYNQLIRGI